MDSQALHPPEGGGGPQHREVHRCFQVGEGQWRECVDILRQGPRFLGCVLEERITTRPEGGGPHAAYLLDPQVLICPPHWTGLVQIVRGTQPGTGGRAQGSAE